MGSPSDAGGYGGWGELGVYGRSVRMNRRDFAHADLRGDLFYKWTSAQRGGFRSEMADRTMIGGVKPGAGD